MIYQPSGSFSWDRVFRPSLMQRILRSLGLKIDGVIIFLNYLQFAVAIVLLVWFLPIAWFLRATVGEKATQPIQPFFGWLWLATFGVYRRAWYHPAIDRNENYVYMAEHFNLIDIPLYVSTWPTDTRALSAMEYKKIPVYGWLIAAAGTQFIERRDRQQAIADLKALGEKMERENISVLLVPTGTRAVYGQRPPFKRGTFHFGVQLKRPIVPMYLVGTENLAIGKNHCKPGRVDVVYGEPIRPEDHPEAFDSVDALQKLVDKRMQEEGQHLRNNRAALQSGRSEVLSN